MRVQHPMTDKYGTRSGSDGVCASQELNIQGSTKLPIDTRLMSLEPGRYRDCVKTLRQFWRWVFDATRRRSGQWLLWTFHTVSVATGSRCNIHSRLTCNEICNPTNHPVATAPGSVFVRRCFLSFAPVITGHASLISN